MNTQTHTASSIPTATLAGTHSLSVRNAEDQQRALILSGGGIRCSYQAGALLAFQEQEYGFGFFDATSGGGINLAALLSGVTPSDLVEHWSHIKPSKTLTMMPLRKYLQRDALVAMGSADGFRDYVLPHMGIDLAQVRSAEGCLANFNVLNFSSKEVEEIPHTQMDEDFLIAGLSLPGVMPPVQKGGSTYLDAAFVQDANLMAAVREGAEELWVLWCLGNTPQYRGGALRIYVQMLEMAAHGALHREFREIAALNRRIAQGDSPYGQRSAIRVHLIRPEVPIPLDPELYLGRVSTDDLMAMGYRDTVNYLKQRTSDGIALSHHSTAMTAPSIGVRFRKTLTGVLECDAQVLTSLGFLLPDSTDIELQISTYLTLTDKASEGFSHGSLCLGQVADVKLRSLNGAFKTMVQDSATQFSWQLNFRYQANDYCLIGYKTIRSRTFLASLLNTLQPWTCTLHQGLDEQGPVLARAQLRASILSTLKMLISLCITDASSMRQALVARYQFIRKLAGKRPKTAL